MVVEGKLGERPAGSSRFARGRAPRTGLLDSLDGVAAALADPLPLDRLAAVVADAAEAALDAAAVVIALPDDAGAHLRPVHERGDPHDPGAASLAVPVPLAGRRAGALLVGRARDRRFTPEERAYLQVLTTLLGLALQRSRREPPAGSHLRVGDLEIDLGQQRVVAGDRDVRLTPSEIRLLLFLAEEPGRPRTRREILRHLWRTDHVVDERACDAHVSNLRRKIERDPSHPQRLVTVRSVGYALKPM